MSDAQEPLDISAQGTPNPNAIKFMLNRVVATQGKTYRLSAVPSSAQAGEAASADVTWAKRILEVPGVTQVFTINNFVSVNKRPEADWNVVGPQVEQVLRQAFA